MQKSEFSWLKRQLTKDPFSEIANMLHSGLASVQTFVYVAKNGDACTDTRPECTLFGYLRKVFVTPALMN